MAAAKKTYPVSQPPKVVKLATFAVRMCDGCHIATAQFEVVCRTGYIYLCGHHRTKHGAHIEAEGYTVRKLKGAL